MRKKLIGLALFASVIMVACSSTGSGQACASPLSVHDIAAQHGVFTTSYVARGFGGSSHVSVSHSSYSHSSGGSSKAPSSAGSHSSSHSPSNSGSHSTKTVTGSRASSYKGPTSVSHSSYVYHGSGGKTITYHHYSVSHYNSAYSAHYHWVPGAAIDYDPYNPWNYYNPYSPYYHIHLASC